MAAKERSDRTHIVGGLKRVKIIGAFPQSQALCAKLFVSLAITQSDAAPVVALQQYKGAREHKSCLLFWRPKQISQDSQQTWSFRDIVISSLFIGRHFTARTL